MYSSIFSSTSRSRSEIERNSMTKSGQISVNSSCSSSVRRFHRLFGIHDASGDRFAPLGSVKMVEESNTTPVPSCSAQTTSRGDLRVSPSRFRIGGRHDDQLLLRGHLDPKIAIVATKPEKLIVSQADGTQAENKPKGCVCFSCRGSGDSLPLRRS